MSFIVYNGNSLKVGLKGCEEVQHISRKREDEGLRRIFLYIALFAVLPFLYFAIIGYSDWTNVTIQDYEIGSFFYALRTPIRTTVATGITRLADRETQVILTLIIAAILFAFKKWRTGLWYGLSVLIGAGLLNGGVKELYGRVRPEEIEHLVLQGGYTFPSGHAMGSMIVYGGLLFLIARAFYFSRRNLRGLTWLLGLFIGLLILVIGLSRIYLGVHYPSDVIGGFSLGFAWLSLSIALLGLKFTREEFQSQRKYSFRRF